jgi:hypothetical protein
MRWKPSITTLALLGGAFGASFPARAGLEELMQQITAFKTEPRIELMVRLAQEAPEAFHILGHNLGTVNNQTCVSLITGPKAARTRTQLASHWVNANHLRAVLPDWARDCSAEDRQAMTLEVTVHGAADVTYLVRHKGVPVRNIRTPLELIGYPDQPLHRSEVFDTKADREGLVGASVRLQYTTGHQNTMVARAFALTEEQVAKQVQSLPVKPPVAQVWFDPTKAW